MYNVSISWICPGHKDAPPSSEDCSWIEVFIASWTQWYPVPKVHPPSGTGNFSSPLRLLLACGHCVFQWRSAFLCRSATSEALHKTRGVHQHPIARCSSPWISLAFPLLVLMLHWNVHLNIRLIFLFFFFFLLQIQHYQLLKFCQPVAS